MTQIVSLPHRSQIRLTGPDWAPFLKGLCTAPVDSLTGDNLIRPAAQSGAQDLIYGAFLRPQGKMYADCLLQAVSADEIRLDVALNARDELLAKLNMYKLRAKVTIEPCDTPVFVAFDGPAPDGFTPDARGHVLEAPLAFAYTPQIANASQDDWTKFRFRNGLSDPGADFAPDELYAIDANLDLLGGIDFHKGCYVGQELTSRMKRRGQIKNRILPLVHTGVIPRDAEVLLGDRRAGNILASTDGASLALMRLDRLDGDLTCNDVAVALDAPAWIRPHNQIIQT